MDSLSNAMQWGLEEGGNFALFEVIFISFSEQEITWSGWLTFHGAEKPKTS